MLRLHQRNVSEQCNISFAFVVEVKLLFSTESSGNFLSVVFVCITVGGFEIKSLFKIPTTKR